MAFRDLDFPAAARPADSAAITDRASAGKMLDRLGPAGLANAISRLKEAGVTASRWSSPDLLEQLRRSAEHPPKFIVCGAIDLDPALPLQRTLSAERAMDVAAGAAALGKLLGTARVILAVPEDMTSAGVRALRDAAQAVSVRLFPLLEQYPLAEAALLARRTTGRRIPPGKLPTDAGVLVLDAPAAVAISRCLAHDESMVRVPLGIYDETHSRSHLLRVAVGTRLDGVLAAVEAPAESTELWAGHVLRHVRIDRQALLGHGELTISVSAPRRAEASAACLRCGWCVEACPVQVHPAGLLDAAQQNDPQIADHYGLRACIDCGICSYVCPSRLPLLEAIRGMKK